MEWLAFLAYAAPVAYAALGETLVQRSGVLNIGLEGAMLFAAFAGMIVTLMSGVPLLGFAVGGAVGVAVALAFGWFTVKLGADQVVTGTAVNLLALGVTSTLYRARFGQSGSLVSIPKLPSYGIVDPALLLLFLLVPGAWFLLSRTGWGLAVRAAGEYPKAAEASGFSVAWLRLSALALGGLLAGLGGAYLSVGISGSFAENMTAGRGFVAIAMVTFGRWRPQWTFAAALLIGFAETLQFRFQALGLQAPYQLMIAMPYLVALAVLVVVGRGAAAPGALGQTYRRES